METALEELASALRFATRVVVATGAGMSRESGIPTFREARTGLWARYDPEEMASERGFRAAPARVFGWYAWRRTLAARALPHAGFGALVRLEARIPGLVVVTQNVDGLHRRAGTRRLIELHGALDRFSCLDARHPYPADRVPMSEEERAIEPPPCPRCGSPVRPDVVWFGEALPEQSLADAWEEAAQCQVMLVVGTSGMVYPAASLPGIAYDAGALVAELNPEPTEVSRWARVVCRGTAAVLLPGLAAALEAS